MSILIKGMEMPKVCAECPFREVRYDPGYYNYEHCKALGKIFNEHSMEIDVFEEKFNDCPLVEIVTCGECIHFHYDKPYIIQGIPVLGHEVCDFWGNGCKTNPNGFCSYGERRK